jgi:hypothetical protein
MGAKVVFLHTGESHSTAAAPRRVTVPAAAVVNAVDGARVWIVENGRASARLVETGPERGDLVEIRKGLSGGESVIVRPPAGLKDGARVRAAGSS